MRRLMSMAIGCGLICLGWAGAARGRQARRSAQTTPQTTRQPTPRTNLIYSLRGNDLYRAYCASCHGVSGKGDGPVAPELKTKVPDLTVLSENNGGEFPAARVRTIITGDAVIAAHGSREMPIWGPIFHQIESDRDFGNVRIANLIKYLQSIQTVKPPGGTPSK